MLKNLELRKDADKYKKQNEIDTPFEMTQDEIYQCIMKEDSNNLKESLNFMV